MQVEYLSAVTPRKPNQTPTIKWDRSACSLYLQHSFSLSDPISLLFTLRCSDNIYLRGKKETQKRKRIYSACALAQGFKLYRGDEQSSPKYRVWVIHSVLDCNRDKRELHFLWQHSGVLMMRTSIFIQQPLPTHLSTKHKAGLVYKSFIHYITKFQIFAENQKTSLFYNQ